MSLSPSSGNIGVGDTVTLSCEVGSSHPPVSGYHWYKDGMAVGTEQVLALQAVRREDHGRYHCEAQNALGTGVSPPVTLRVFCKCHGSSEGWHTAECPRLGWEVAGDAGGAGIGVAPLCRTCVPCVGDPRKQGEVSSQARMLVEIQSCGGKGSCGSLPLLPCSGALPAVPGGSRTLPDTQGPVSLGIPAQILWEFQPSTSTGKRLLFSPDPTAKTNPSLPCLSWNPTGSISLKDPSPPTSTGALLESQVSPAGGRGQTQMSPSSVVTP